MRRREPMMPASAASKSALRGLFASVDALSSGGCKNLSSNGERRISHKRVIAATVRSRIAARAAKWPYKIPSRAAITCPLGLDPNRVDRQPSEASSWNSLFGEF
jgi:hypothetical protein